MPTSLVRTNVPLPTWKRMRAQETVLSLTCLRSSSRPPAPAPSTTAGSAAPPSTRFRVGVASCLPRAGLRNGVGRSRNPAGVEGPALNFGVAGAEGEAAADSKSACARVNVATGVFGDIGLHTGVATGEEGDGAVGDGGATFSTLATMGVAFVWTSLCHFSGKSEATVSVAGAAPTRTANTAPGSRCGCGEGRGEGGPRPWSGWSGGQAMGLGGAPDRNVGRELGEHGVCGARTRAVGEVTSADSRGVCHGRNAAAGNAPRL
mmetsp:Transcript_30900/g.67689  ORF Transcript_30900/g.67689 Transcript_30900/m.67689 type:complete len:262 (+) Transcript_30900:1362-2147(+)